MYSKVLTTCVAFFPWFVVQLLPELIPTSRKITGSICIFFSRPPETRPGDFGKIQPKNRFWRMYSKALAKCFAFLPCFLVQLLPELISTSWKTTALSTSFFSRPPEIRTGYFSKTWPKIYILANASIFYLVAPFFDECFEFRVFRVFESGCFGLSLAWLTCFALLAIFWRTFSNFVFSQFSKKTDVSNFLLAWLPLLTNVLIFCSVSPFFDECLEFGVLKSCLLGWHFSRMHRICALLTHVVNECFELSAFTVFCALASLTCWTNVSIFCTVSPFFWRMFRISCFHGLGKSACFNFLLPWLTFLTDVSKFCFVGDLFGECFEFGVFMVVKNGCFEFLLARMTLLMNASSAFFLQRKFRILCFHGYPKIRCFELLPGWLTFLTNVSNLVFACFRRTWTYRNFAEWGVILSEGYILFASYVAVGDHSSVDIRTKRMKHSLKITSHSPKILNMRISQRRASTMFETFVTNVSQASKNSKHPLFRKLWNTNFETLVKIMGQQGNKSGHLQKLVFPRIWIKCRDPASGREKEFQIEPEHFHITHPEYLLQKASTKTVKNTRKLRTTWFYKAPLNTWCVFITEAWLRPIDGVNCRQRRTKIRKTTNKYQKNAGRNGKTSREQLCMCCGTVLSKNIQLKARNRICCKVL